MASERRSVMNRVQVLEVSTTPTSRRQRRLSYAHRQRRDEREGAAEAAAPSTMKLKSVGVRGESVDWPEDDLHVVPAPRQRPSGKASIESRDAPPLRTLSHPQSPRRGSRKSSPNGKSGRRSNHDENTNPVIKGGSSVEWPSENERPSRAEERAPSPLRRDDKSISSRSSKQRAIPQQRVPPPTKDKVDIEQPGSFKRTTASRLSDGLKRSLYDASTVLQEERASSVASSSASLSSDELSSIAMRALKTAQRRSQKEKPNFLDSRSSDVGSASSRSRASNLSLAKKRTATRPKNLESSKDDSSSLASANSSRNSRFVASKQRAANLRENHDRKYDDSVSVLSANSLRSARFSAAKKRTAHLRRAADNVNDDVPSVTSASPGRPSRGSDLEDARSTASDKLKKKFKDRAHSLASHSMSARTRRSTDADENTISSGDDGSTIVSEMKPPFVPSGFPRKASKDADHVSQTSNPHGSPQAGNRHCSPDRTARIPFLPSNSIGYSHRNEFPVDSIMMQQNSSKTTSDSVGEESSKSRDPPGTTEREQAKRDPPLDGTRAYDSNLSPSPVKNKKSGPPIVNRHSGGTRLILTPQSSHEAKPSRQDTDDGSMCSSRSLRSSTREAALQALRGRSPSPSPTPTGRTPDMNRNLHLHHPTRGSSDKSVTSSTASARSPARRRAFEHAYYKKNHHKDQYVSPEVRREASCKENSGSPVAYVKGDADLQQSTPENSVSSQKERRLKVSGKSKAAWQVQTGYNNNQRSDDMISPRKTRSEETYEGISSKEQKVQQETLEIGHERRAQRDPKKSPQRISDEPSRGPGRSDIQHCSTAHALPVRSPRSSGKRQGTNCGTRKCETKQEQTRNQNDCEPRMQRDDRISSPRRTDKDQRSVRKQNQRSLREKKHGMIGSGSARSPHTLEKGEAKSPSGGAWETQSRQKGEGGQNTSMQQPSPKQARGVPWPTVDQPIQSDQSVSSSPKKPRTKPSQQHTSPNENMASTTQFGSTNVARSPRKDSAWHVHARSEDDCSNVSKSDAELYKATASTLRSPTRSLNTETESFTSKDTSLSLGDAEVPQSVEAHEKMVLSKEKKLASRNAYLTHLEQKKALPAPLEISQKLCAPSATPAPFSQVSDYSSTDPVRQRFLNDKSLLDGSSHCEDGTDASSFTRSSEESSMPSTSMVHKSEDEFVLPRTNKSTAAKSEAASRMNHTVPEDQSVHFDEDHSRSAPLSPESSGSALRKRSLLGPFRTGSSDASEGSLLNGEGSTLIGQLHIDSQGSDRSNLKKEKRSKSGTAKDERGNDALEWWKENYAGSQDKNVNSIVESVLTPTSSGVPFEEGTASVKEFAAKGEAQKVREGYPTEAKGTNKTGYNEDVNFRSMRETDQELESVFSDGTLFSGLEESTHVKTDPKTARKNIWGKETGRVGVISSPDPTGGENHDHVESAARQTEPAPMLSSLLAPLPPPPPPPPEHFGELLDESQLMAPVNSDITTSIIAEGVKDLVDRNITSSQVIQEEESDDLTDEDTDRSEAEDIKTGNSLHRSKSSFSRKSQRSARSRQQVALPSLQDEEEGLHTRQNETTVSVDAEDRSMKEEEQASLMSRGAGREAAATFSSHESGDEYASTAFTNPSGTAAGQSTEAPDPGNIGAVFLRFGNSILDSFERVCRFPDEDMPTNNNVDEVKQGVQIVDASDAFSIADSALSGTQSTMNELEANKWDEWDRRDSQSVLSNADTSNDNTRCTDVESQFTEDNVFSRQAMAHKKLLDFSKSAMTHSSQDCSDDDSPSEILSSGVSGSYIDTGDESSMTPEPRSSGVQLQKASRPQNHSSLPSALSLNQRRILEKFCASLKNQGVEVLKQNRDTKWQAKTLTVSKEMAEINHVKLAHNKNENCYCPGALLWLKKFNKGSRDYSTALIDKQGRGGVLLSRLVRVTATGRSDPAQQLPRKYQDKYKDSVTVLMEYNLHGKTRSMALRCKTTDEAHFLCTGLRVCMDILKRENEANY